MKNKDIVKIIEKYLENKGTMVQLENMISVMEKVDQNLYQKAVTDYSDKKQEYENWLEETV